MTKHKRTGFALFALLGVSIFPPRAGASSVDGTWNIRNLALEIFDCQNSVCGRIAGVNDPRKRRQTCGKTIVWGLAPSGPSTWANGWILDPDDGNTYNLSATLQPDGTLRARIYRGIPLFGKTEILKRIAPRSMAGWC